MDCICSAAPGSLPSKASWPPVNHIALCLHALQSQLLACHIIIIHFPARRLGVHQEFVDFQPPLFTSLSYFVPVMLHA